MTIRWAKDRERLALLALGSAIILAALVTLFVMRRTDFRGDEYTYIEGARALGAASSGNLEWSVALDRLIGTGWFMPGASILAAPIFAFAEDPPFLLIRAWAAAIELSLWGVLVWRADKLLGRPYAFALLLFPLLAAGWHVMAATFQPDAPAGALLGLLLLEAYAIGSRAIGGHAVRPILFARFTLLAVAAIYVRGPLLLAFLGLAATLLLLLHWRKRAGRGAALGLFGAIGGVALLLAPWSAAVSLKFGRFVPTTTNVPLVMADSFGDPARTCFGPCSSGQDIWPAWRFAQSEAARTGEHALDIQRRMMQASLAKLTVRDYLARARTHFATFLVRPQDFVESYKPVMWAVRPDWRPALFSIIAAATLVLYVPFMLALLAANVRVFRRSDPARLQSLLIKAVTAATFVQPFVHKASGRYWVTLAPLAAWSAALLYAEWRDRNITAGEAHIWLDRVQFGYVFGFLSVALIVLLA